MPTQFTQRLVIVVKAALRQTANDIAQVADPTTDNNTFTQPLRVAGDVSNAVVAYWTAWTMTPTQRQALADEFGRRAGSFPVYVKGQSIPSNVTYWAFLSADQDPVQGFTPAEVLTVLGYDRLVPPTPGG